MAMENSSSGVRPPPPSPWGRNFHIPVPVPMNVVGGNFFIILVPVREKKFPMGILILV